MSNTLGMSNINSILRLREQGWSFSRIARELALHRTTVAKYVREHPDGGKGFDDPKPTEVHTGSESKPTEVHTGSTDPCRSTYELHREVILQKLELGLSIARTPFAASAFTGP